MKNIDWTATGFLIMMIGAAIAVVGNDIFKENS